MLVTRTDIATASAQAGVEPGDTLLVHASLSALGHVVGGAEAVILALLDAVGPSGTLAAPAQTWLNLDPSTGVHGRPEEDWPTIRAALLGFDRETAPSVGMGAVAEAIRKWPGSARSNHPVRSWSAIGASAAHLMAEHDLEDVHGPRSPLGAALDDDARVLLLGTPYAKCTALHLAETLSAHPKTTERITTWRRTEEGRVALHYDNLVFDDADFDAIGAAFEEAAGTPVIPIGTAHVRAPRLRALVRFATRMMETTR